MAFTNGIVKTYGRHKYRIVKENLWISPESDRDEALKSPAAKKERVRSRFECASSFGKANSNPWAKPLTSCSNNLTKSKWNHFAWKSPSRCSNAGKENSSYWGRNVSSETHGQENQRKHRSSSNKSPKARDSSSNMSPWQPADESTPDKLDNAKQILVYDMPDKVSRSHATTGQQKSPRSVQDNCEHSNSAAESKKNVHMSISSSDSSFSCVGRHSSSSSSVLLSNSPVLFSSSSEAESVLSSMTNVTTRRHRRDRQDNFHIMIPSDEYISSHNMHSASSPTMETSVDVVLSSPIGDSRNQADDMKYSTSTPLETFTSRKNSCNDSSSRAMLESVGTEHLSNCRVVIQPLEVTPDLLSRSKESSPVVSEAHTQTKASASKENQAACQGECNDSKRVDSKQKLLLKECVVSLENLRLTPLVKERKRMQAVNRIDGEWATGTPGPQRGNRCVLSFKEALTPARKSSLANQDSESESDKPDWTPLEKVLMECEQDKPITFRQLLRSSVLGKCVKVGEGVYGEVFKTVNTRSQQLALKIIPVEGDFSVNGEPQKTFEEILPEIVISKELSGLSGNEGREENLTPNFVHVHKVSLVRGKYPAQLLKQWDEWDDENGSENERPDFPNDQLFIVFEFADGGRDLERFEFGSNSEALGVLRQIALSLAVAENALEFEHRDLHWGNVLIGRAARPAAEYRLNGQDVRLDTSGVFVSLIDFTLSRLNKDKVTVFGNLADDESLFTGKGDYQFDIYRLMRKANRNKWEHFEPYSNVLWLHYLTDKMLKKKHYPVLDKDVEATMKRFLRQARRYKSATELVEDDVLF